MYASFLLRHGLGEAPRTSPKNIPLDFLLVFNLQLGPSITKSLATPLPEMHQFITLQILVEFLPNKKENLMNLMSKLADTTINAYLCICNEP